jgi:hypothetical protein
MHRLTCYHLVGLSSKSSLSTILFYALILHFINIFIVGLSDLDVIFSTKFELVVIDHLPLLLLIINSFFLVAELLRYCCSTTSRENF